jgi:hypothetical protein
VAGSPRNSGREDVREANAEWTSPGSTLLRCRSPAIVVATTEKFGRSIYAMKG